MNLPLEIDLRKVSSILTSDKGELVVNTKSGSVYPTKIDFDHDNHTLKLSYDNNKGNERQVEVYNHR